ncbi:sodium:proton antiporter [Thalassobacillus devorans]|uniref:Sodium:proton antiporter n=1 Tax=Thalassobacillus devorans TaxID=279813 RepID=A0ABQ1PNC7_9BACI|nr:Na+/H+ antiporter NhaC family protein [Thalassobacillus devorans]NIK30286.1 Na+/H+ antiporter NhaC [Thalassobacillus devorans]GGC99863.1 sodium:proton antiporter [Thalassobacillus devorans]
MGWMSVIPFVAVVVAAIWTKQVVPSLLLAVVVAGYLAEPDWLGGMTTSLQFIIEGLQDENNLKIIIFLYAFSALIGLIKFAGGIKGFVRAATEKVDTKRGAFLLTWLSSVGTFSAPSFRIVTIAPVMKAMRKKLPMTKQELAFVIETTASPLVVLIPVATAFVGYMSSVIEMSIHQAGTEGDPYRLYLQSIPFNFFAFAMLGIGFYLSFFHRNKKSATDAEDGTKSSNEEDDQWEDCHPAVAKDLPNRPWTLIIPLFSVIILTFLLMYVLGLAKGEQGFQALINANVLDAMVLAVVLTIVFLMVYLKIARQPLRTMMNTLIHEGNEMMGVIVLLAMVWGLSKGSEALQFADTVSSSFGWIPPGYVAVVLFIVGCGLSYFIGSSWGTWGILMPVGLSIAVSAGSSLPIVIGAVFASGTFGAFASPLSDDTNTTAGILDLNPVKYAKFKLKPALLAAGLAAALYFAFSFFM